MFLTASPAILGYEMIEGPWNHRGALRRVRAEGDSSFLEQVKDFARPHLFGYQISDFAGGTLEPLTD